MTLRNTYIESISSVQSPCKAHMPQMISNCTHTHLPNQRYTTNNTHMATRKQTVSGVGWGTWIGMELARGLKSVESADMARVVSGAALAASTALMSWACHKLHTKCR